MSDVTITNAPASQATVQTEQVGDGNPDGQLVGKTTTSKVGFFGATPVAQQAYTASLVTTTGYNTGTSGLYSTTTLNANFINAVAQIQAALINLGLIA